MANKKQHVLKMVDVKILSGKFQHNLAQIFLNSNLPLTTRIKHTGAPLT